MRTLVKCSFLLKSSVFVILALTIPFSSATAKDPKENGTNPIILHWLDNAASSTGVTWGVPWKQGQLRKITGFVLKNEDSNVIFQVQSWPLAYWPDGSIKWTAHASVPGGSKSTRLQLIPTQENNKISDGLLVQEFDSTIRINTGKLQCFINKKGNILISSIKYQGKELAKEGKLVVLQQNVSDTEDSPLISKTLYQSRIEKVTLEQKGSIRAVVKLEGRHFSDNNKTLLPYVVRLYFYKGSETIKIMHTIIYDGNEKNDFIKGIGFQFSVPLKEELYNRHVRFVGENNGVFAEAIKGITGLRRYPGKEIITAQIEGRKILQDSIPENILKGLKYVPAFGDYTLSQLTSNDFNIRKRTENGCSWLDSAFGNKSQGTGYIGTPTGGLAFGIRNFWQSYPAKIDIKNANTDLAKVTLWLWAPAAPAMDLRFYHDGMGQKNYEQQNEGLDITYEDYELGFSTPYGVARTSELSISALGATPSNEKLAEIAHVIQQPPLLICTPEFLKEQQIFGNNWSLPDSLTPEKKQIEEQLDWNITYYQTQIEQRGWYGFWNFGDVMHSYDSDRHVWKYDIGGFAWDNSELSTDLWLWYSFLRTGKADIFRMAEAMTRHTGEVDVYHIGTFAPLGSRHNVMHWGCSAKQLRISTAANRRFFYYLTADERVGDLLHEQVDGLKKLHEIVPTRKRIEFDPRSKPANIVWSSFGTDWGAICAAWFTEWERTKDPEIKDKLINSMKTIAQQPKKFFTGNGYLDTNTGKFEISTSNRISASHLNAVFGLTEMCEELIQTLNIPEFTDVWLQYCRLYNASPEEQQTELGSPLPKMNLRQAHARLTAYAAWYNKDKDLAKRAWLEFYSGRDSILSSRSKELKLINAPEVLKPVLENPYISTNEIAQWGLSAIQCLNFIGNK
jgi:hypothetical protein